MIRNSSIKILHIITRLDLGGSSTNTIDTVVRLGEKGYDVSLLVGKTNDPNGEIKAELKGEDVKYLFINELCREISPINDWKAFWRIYHLMRREKFTIVHTHSSKAGIVGRWAAKFAGAKIVIHTPHGHIFYGYFNFFITRMYVYIERITSLVTDRIITLTDIGKQEHVQLKVAHENKFQTIYSGIDLNKFKKGPLVAARVREEFSIKEEDVLLGTVARLDPIKGCEYLVDAMKFILQKYPNTKLILVGDGSERKTLEEKCRSYGIDKNVIFAGQRDDVSDILSALDIFILPSLNEGMGRVILEAMACEIPIVASRTGGIPELIEDSEHGLLVSPKDTESLECAIMFLISDKSRAQRMAKKAKKMVTEKFSVDKMVDDIESLYKVLISVKL